MLAALYLALELAAGLGGDALGAGLLAFAAIALASFVWAIVAATFSIG